MFISYSSFIRKLKLSLDLNSRSILKDSTQLILSKNLVFRDTSALSATTTIGDIQRKKNFVEILSILFVVLKFYSCVGKYTFIGNGVGKGKKITYAEAWKGKLPSLFIHDSI